MRDTRPHSVYLNLNLKRWGIRHIHVRIHTTQTGPHGDLNTVCDLKYFWIHSSSSNSYLVDLFFF